MSDKIAFIALAVAVAATMFWNYAFADLTNTVCATNSVDCTAVSVTGANRMVVKRLTVSLASKDNLTFKCGTTVLAGPLYFGADSGLIDVFDLPGGRQSEWKCGAGQNFNVTKGTATTPLTVITTW